MFIRRLGPRDAAAFREIRLQALQDHPTAFGADHASDAQLPLAAFAQRLQDTAVFAGFADANEVRMLGTAGLFRANSPKSRHIATLWGVYLRPEARGIGLARPLIDAVTAEAAKDCRSLRLSVQADNAAAIRLYQAAGFVEWARDHGALLVDGQLYDEILMRRDLA